MCIFYCTFVAILQRYAKMADLRLFGKEFVEVKSEN